MIREIKTKYRHINFQPEGEDGAAKGRWWIRNNKSGGILGAVIYYRRWKSHIVQFEDTAVFDINCLRDIANFMDQLSPQVGQDKGKK